mgnify:CR=1 FL=1
MEFITAVDFISYLLVITLIFTFIFGIMFIIPEVWGLEKESRKIIKDISKYGFIFSAINVLFMWSLGMMRVHVFEK